MFVFFSRGIAQQMTYDILMIIEFSRIIKVRGIIMNDNEKFKKFFGFGGSDQTDEQINEGTHNEAESSSGEVTAELLKKSQATVAEWTEKYITLSADFQNYRKRIDSERVEWSLEGQKKVLMALLVIADDFERALDQERKREQVDGVEWLAGFEMIYQSIEKLLHSFGVKEITDIAHFDPKYHEALVQVDSANHESGAIVHILKKGYLFHDKVLRPATVSVAR
jgi:molecular chaperone GrpE